MSDLVPGVNVTAGVDVWGDQNGGHRLALYTPTAGDADELFQM